MPDARGLLGRWSRLKRAEDPGPQAADPAPGEDADAPELPPIEELGPDSDYTMFMRRNVPAALRRAALRRAWACNPAIAKHKPLVDYDWDFHAPGFGRLWPVDDPAKLLATLFAPTRRSAPTADEAGDPPGAIPPDDRSATPEEAPAQPAAEDGDPRPPAGPT